MLDYLAIIKRNIFSPIVIAIALLAGALLYIREYRDAWFISVVIIINALIGIVQEIRAKRALRKLELMSAPKARLVRGDEVVEVDYQDLKVGDEIALIAGDEVPADANLVMVRDLEVDESMLTGESVSVGKTEGDTIYAATLVVAGSARAKVSAVGQDTKAGKIGSVLKHYKPELTPLQHAIQRIVSWMTFGAIGLAAVIALVYYFSGHDPVTILKTIVSAAVTVVPEGLLLASSLLLAFGSIKLAQVKVLPQKLAAIEAMALLDLLCVDKTGTLTSDKIELDKIMPFGGSSESDLSLAALIISKEASSGNATGEAIANSLDIDASYVVIETMAFSSARKMSGVRVQIGDNLRTFVMGAPEYVSQLIAVDEGDRLQISELVKTGRRVLLVAELSDNTTPLKQIESSGGVVLGMIILVNSLRKGVKETVKFLQDQGVRIRVISGDNPFTVQYVAREAGIDNPDSSITGSVLSTLHPRAWAKAADEQTIFARVLPEQKEQLIEHYQKQGLFTGMVGDGVNDALALKKADLGVAMYAGAVTSRRVSDIILLNNSFTSLPLGMKLGNRIMQAVELIATLFFHKIIYGVVLLVGTLLLGMVYPFEPRHVTFMNMFLVSLPTIMWTLFPPLPKHRVSPAFFWRDTLRPILPIAVLSGLSVLFTYWIMSLVYPERPVHVATMTVVTATFFGVYVVFLTARMLGVTMNKTAKRARLLYIVAVVVVAVNSFGWGFLREFFDFSLPTIWILWPAIGVIVLAAIIQWQLAKAAGRKFIPLPKEDSAP